jgi:formyltetrahydrofolate hydrolase
LRLSASQIGKLQNEFRLVCNENEELKKKVTEYEVSYKKVGKESETKIALLSQEL